MLGEPCCEGVIFRDEPGAPALDGVEFGLGCIRLATQVRQTLGYRIRLDLTHQAANILQLPAAGLTAAQAAGRQDRLVQSLGELQTVKLLGWQVDQGLAERLQGVHGLFALGLAWRPEFWIVHTGNLGRGPACYDIGFVNV